MAQNASVTQERRFEHSVPFFWPLAPFAELGEEAADTFRKSFAFAAEAERAEFGLEPVWATPNAVLYDLDTMRLRDFSDAAARRDPGVTPTVIDAPYAGHHATIADYARGQSLVETLLANGVRRVLCTDWKSATDRMKDYDIDIYLAEINAVADDLGGRINLVGLCQGGWMAAMFAARYPDKVATLVAAGAPLDCDAGDGFLKRFAQAQPMSFFEDLVAAGGGLLRGRFMLAGWKSMHPEEHYFKKYLELYENIDDPAYIAKREAFERWYENPLDLPGRWYLQAVRSLFKDNAFCKGEFMALGRKIGLGDIVCPTFLLAGESDDITPSPQVFSARDKLGAPADRIVSKLVPGGHIGLFMGSRTLRDAWPGIAAWIRREGGGA